MIANVELKTLVSTLLRSRGAVADAARSPEHQRMIGPILAEIDRTVAALDPNMGAAVPLSTLDETAPVPATDVEALRREIERLRAVAQNERGLLDAVLTHIPYGVIVSDSQGRLILQNRAAEKIWAGSATANDVEGWGQYRAFHPDGRPYEAGDWAMARALSRGETVDAAEVHFQRFDGTHGILLGSAAPVLGPNAELTGAVSTFADITRFKRLEQAVLQAEEQRRFIGEASFFLASLVLDYEETLSAVAATAVPRLGDWCFVDLIEPDGTLTRAALAHVDPDRAPLARALRHHKTRSSGPNSALLRVVTTRKPESRTEVIEQMLEASGDAPEYIERLRRLDADSSITVPLRVRDSILGTVTFVCVESERRFGRDEILLAEQFGNCAGLAVGNASLYREAQRVNQIKDEFLGVLSHELRTPLNAILGWSRLVRTGKLDDKRRARALETIERNAQVQTQLIEDLLDVSRIISGKFRVENRAVYLPAVIEAAIDSVRLAANTRGIELRTRIGKVPEITGDPMRLQQIVWNLLSNAIKFTHRGGHVDVVLRQVDSHIELEVSDDGHGIPVEFLPHVFDRFRQADATTTRAHNGLGLGLAIVRHLVEIHGGSVRAESGGLGTGAAFNINLPISSVKVHGTSVEDRANSEHELPLEQPPPLHGVQVLVVDDEIDARDLVEMVLTEQGASVTAVGSVPEALEAIERHRPDVLVSDIGMPSEDGYTLIRKVKAMEKRVGRIPAAALTAYAGVQDRTHALLAGYSSHVPKPIEPTELAAVVANLAGRINRP